MTRLSKMPYVLLTVAALVVVFGAHLSSGQAPSPTPNCDSAIFALAPCLDFVSNSSVTTVAPLCCGSLSNLSTSNPVCLCEFLTPDYANQGAALGINATKALELPGLCSLPVSVSSCAALLGPVAAPGLAPTLAPVLAPTPFLAPIIAPPALAPATPIPTPLTPAPAIAPSPSDFCGFILVELAPCLSFFTGTPGPPLDACCIGFAIAETTSPACLCDLVAPGNINSIPGINVTLALELPSACNASAEALSCAAATPIPTPGGETPSTTPSSSPKTSVAPGPAEDCQSELVPLLPCLEFLKDTDNSPSQACCTNLKDVVDSSPTCICSLVSAGSASIPGINSTRALELPGLCEINVSLSTCTGPSTGPSTSAPGRDDTGVAVKAALPSLSMAIACILVVSSFVLLQPNGVDLWPSLFI